MLLSCRLLMLSGFLVCLLSASAWANNGSVAYAYPIPEIQADGILSDWPSNAKKYPIERSQNRYPPEWERDFQAYFMVGYHLESQTLFVAVHVVDDLHIKDDKSDADHLSQDGHLLYLDAKHDKTGSGVAFYALSADRLRIIGQELSWDPDFRAADTKHISSAVNRKGSTTTYEWKIDLGDELVVNRSLGMDHVIIDKDNHDPARDYSTMAWGSNGWKSSMQNNLGDIFIVDSDLQTGSIIGEYDWQDSTLEASIWGLRIESLEHPQLWTQHPLRGKKAYQIDLPVGKYAIYPALPSTNLHGKYAKLSGSSEVMVSVAPDQEVIAPRLLLAGLPPPAVRSDKGLLATFKPPDTLQLDRFFAHQMEYYHIPGVSLALIKSGKVVCLRTYGVKNIYTQEKVDEETLFDSGSVTKSVFAFLVNRLADQGVIDLDKPLHEYVPYPDIEHDERYKKITARHVLSHQTGWPNWRNGQLDFINDPASTFGYSGEGFEYLRVVIEQLSGKDIVSVLSAEVLEPMNLQQTYFTANPAMLERMSFGHYDGFMQIHDVPNEPYMAYSMQTNAKYFSRFLVHLLQREGMSDAAYDEMLRKQIDIPSHWPEPGPGWPQGYGLGVQLKDSPFGLVYGHGGKNGGFECQFELYPDLDLGFVYFTNSSTGNKIKNELRALLISGARE